MSARNRVNVGDHHRVEASRDDRTGVVYVRVRRHKRGQPVSFTLSEWAEFTRMVRNGELGGLIQGVCAQPARNPVYGPHCSHDDCSWITCGESGLVEHPCSQEGCPHCGAPAAGEPEQWATVPERVAAMTPEHQARVSAYLERYPLVRRSPEDSYERVSAQLGET